MEPKTWTENEIVQLIAAEIKACRESPNAVDKTSQAIAEMIYVVLNRDNLIEHTP